MSHSDDREAYITVYFRCGGMAHATSLIISTSDV